MYLLTSLLLSLVVEICALPHGDKPEYGSTGLEWAPCNLDFGLSQQAIKVPIDCATLKVPLDYTGVQSSDTLQLQLLRVSATKEPFKGSVLFNPGGPGISGAEYVATSAPLLNSFLDGYYNLIGFDPRGTGNTIPFACNSFNQSAGSDGPERRDLLVHKNVTDVFLSEAWENAGKIADSCYDNQKETGSFLSTAFAARDMVQIIDALGEDGKLRYWGSSYGTLLGSTFASMFPDRIDRLVLDSVVEPNDFMAGTYLENFIDTEKALLGYFDECIKSPSLCGIANFSGPTTTPQDLVDKLNGAFQDLIDNPKYLPPDAPTITNNKPPPITVYEEVKRRIFQTLYDPSSFSAFSAELALILSRNFTLYETGQAPIPPLSTYNKGTDAFWGVTCSDSGYRADSPEAALPLVAKQAEATSFADLGYPLVWPCLRWRFTAAERYEGPFGGKTSFPILFTGGNHDPVTPLVAALETSKQFEGSSVLIRDGYGHTLNGHPSTCVAKALRAYFIDGILPITGTVCESDTPPFELKSAQP